MGKFKKLVGRVWRGYREAEALNGLFNWTPTQFVLSVIGPAVGGMIGGLLAWVGDLSPLGIGFAVFAFAFLCLGVAYGAAVIAERWKLLRIAKPDDIAPVSRKGSGHAVDGLETAAEPTNTARPLSAREAERKVEVIDSALDHLKEMKAIKDRAFNLRGGLNDMDIASLEGRADRLDEFVEALNTLRRKLAEFHQSNSEYDDIIDALPHADKGEYLLIIPQYAHCCRVLARIQLQNPDLQINEDIRTLFNPCSFRLVKVMKGLEEWQSRAKLRLTQLRKEASG